MIEQDHAIPSSLYSEIQAFFFISCVQAQHLRASFGKVITLLIALTISRQNSHGWNLINSTEPDTA